MWQFKRKVVFLLCLALFSCASNERKPPEVKEEFVTKIEQSNLKLFTYTVVMTMPEGKHRGMRPGGGMHGGKGMRGGMGGGMRSRRGNGSHNGMKRSREEMLSNMKEKFLEKLDDKLAKTGYCREGYTVLDNNFSKGRSQIRGECKEKATEEDRLRFSYLSNYIEWT